MKTRGQYEMVERVAKAIEAEKQRGGMAGSWTNADENRRLAEAAIRAMVEPTPAMCEFAEDNFERNADNIAVCWRAFVTAALSSRVKR